MRIGISANIKKLLISNAGGKCTFPGCDFVLITENGDFQGEFCHIVGLSGGPRYNLQISTQTVDLIENLVLMCPNHHKLIDSQPYIYNVEWLKKAKETHERAAKSNELSSSKSHVDLKKICTISFAESLVIWKENQQNGDEEFWQVFFNNNPRIIAQAIPRSLHLLGQKCYLGGKGIDNQGGNVIDFLYTTRTNKNIVLVEIKTPLTKLMGPQYRSNAYSLSHDLSGAIVQVLNYKLNFCKIK